MTETSEGIPSISVKALSDALAALGAYAEPPSDAQLATAELAEGRAALVARLSNADPGRRRDHLPVPVLACDQRHYARLAAIATRCESWTG